jgi:hypothetical protein
MDALRRDNQGDEVMKKFWWVLAVLALAGCGEEEEDNGEASPEPEPEEQVSALDACAEDDFGAMPLTGPGFDAQGQLIAPLEGDYVVSATVLKLREDAQVQQDFNAAVGAMFPDLFQNEGLIGASLGGSTQCGTARTLAIWRDQGAMLRFAGSASHVAGASRIGEFSTIYKTTAVTVGAADVGAVDWEMQRALLREVPDVVFEP